MDSCVILSIILIIFLLFFFFKGWLIDKGKINSCLGQGIARGMHSGGWKWNQAQHCCKQTMHSQPPHPSRWSRIRHLAPPTSPQFPMLDTSSLVLGRQNLIPLGPLSNQVDVLRHPEEILQTSSVKSYAVWLSVPFFICFQCYQILPA